MERGLNYPAKCVVCNSLFKVKKYRKDIAKFCSRLCCGKVKKGIPTWNKGIKYLAITGDKNPKWIADRSLIKRQTERNNPVYKQWRMAILKKDNYTCVWCGQVGGKLHADHIQEFSKYPDKRYDENNGRTLCIPCHNKRHNRRTLALIR